jgi:lipopolysaccharide export system permease protein
MRIIDRYLLRQFVQVFLICFLSLTGLYVVIDGFGNLEEFIEFARLKRTSVLGVMGQYYAFRTLSFFEATSGILTLIAAMFTVTWIQRHNEMTALQAAGIRKGRIVRSVILAVAVIAGLSAVNREFVVPKCRDQLSYNAQDLGGSNGRKFSPLYDNQSEILFRGGATFANKQRITDPDFLLPPALDVYGKQLSAANAYYLPPEEGKPGGYLLTGVKEPVGLENRPSIKLDGKPIILTPHDETWLKPDECFVVSGISFDQLAGGATWVKLSSVWELGQSLRNPSLDFGADVRVAIHHRITQPLLDMTLLFLGLPLVLSRENRNMFVAIGMCVGVVLVFMSVVLGCQFAGTNYFEFISPALAAWLPLMIFVPWAVAVSDPLRE